VQYPQSPRGFVGITRIFIFDRSFLLQRPYQLPTGSIVRRLDSMNFGALGHRSADGVNFGWRATAHILEYGRNIFSGLARHIPAALIQLCDHVSFEWYFSAVHFLIESHSPYIQKGLPFLGSPYKNYSIEIRN
jgi:hypothetical protein